MLRKMKPLTALILINLALPVMICLPLFFGSCEAVRGGIRDFGAGVQELEQSFDALRGLAQKLKSGAVSLAELRQELLELFRSIQSLTPEDEAKIQDHLTEILFQLPEAEADEIKLLAQVELPAPQEAQPAPKTEEIPTDPDLNGDGQLEWIEIVGFLVSALVGAGALWLMNRYTTVKVEGEAAKKQLELALERERSMLDAKVGFVPPSTPPKEPKA